MDLVYGALLLHSAKKEITEENLEKVVTAAGIKIEKAQIKALVSSLEGVNIDDAIKTSLAAAPAAPEKPEEKKAEKKTEEEDKKKAEEAVEGLSSLFG